MPSEWCRMDFVEGDGTKWFFPFPEDAPMQKCFPISHGADCPGHERPVVTYQLLAEVYPLVHAMDVPVSEEYL